MPTEAELHHAAFAEPSTPGSGVDFQVHAPQAVDAAPPNMQGLYDLRGNGWEWTSTPFLAQPGFEAHLRSYPGYSSDFFDGRHFVVFGGSWATHRSFLRRSFRNWYQHHYPYVWATFRTVTP